jgi:hypothetical protein
MVKPGGEVERKLMHYEYGVVLCYTLAILVCELGRFHSPVHRVCTLVEYSVSRFYFEFARGIWRELWAQVWADTYSYVRLHPATCG